MDNKIIWLFLFIGSTLGGLIPLLWGDGAFSLSAIVWSAIGGVGGIWVGYKITR